MGELQQVTNLFDMTTDCKVTELFCIIDKFCKHFDAENLPYLCHDDFFSFPPKQGRQSSLGDFLLTYAKAPKLYNTDNQNVRFVSANLRQSLH